MDTFIENKDKKIAIAIAIVFHTILLFIFLSIIFIKPVRLFEREDFVLGMISDNGNSLAVNVVSPKIPKTSTSNDRKAEKNIIDLTETSTFVNTPSVIKESPSPDLQNALMKIHRLKNSNGIKNDQFHGIINNSTVVQREDTPSTEEVFLTHRILMEKPAHIKDSSEEGIVVVAIIVNEFGKVIRAIAGQRGSTTTSSVLYSKACRAAYQAKFNPSPEGVKEQRGAYTFVFTLE